ncbi:MAG: hypothetical protein ACR2RB_12205 [Gammaproteobacteria bacterium]
MDGGGVTLNQQFLNGADAIRDQLEAFDGTGTNIFDLGTDQRLLKLAVLLGDKLRADIAYPMDKETTADTVFFNAGAADGFRLAARRHLPAIGRGDVDVHGSRQRLPVHLLYAG